MSNQQNDIIEEDKLENEEEKPYCTCGKTESFGNSSNESRYKCFNCDKPPYSVWWAGEMNKETATSIVLTKTGESRLKAIKDNLKIVLDFVERWNKQDKEVDVAEAARFLEGILDL